METLISLIILSFLIIRNRKLSQRIERCEKTLGQLIKEKVEPLIEAPIKQVEPQVVLAATLPLDTQPINPIERSKKADTKSSFKIPPIIKENWIGVFGSVALVIGAVFFGLMSDFMQSPEVRVGALLFISIFFLGICYKLKNNSEWRTLCSWLKSIAGSLILLATLGAGGVEGLQFIDSPLLALCFLCFGVAVNTILAFTAASQHIASLHVVLSMVAFCLLPPALVQLPLGATVACIGLITAYRSKWDLHLFLIVIAFATQNTHLTLSLDWRLFENSHYLGTVCSLAVGLLAAGIHYRKKYKAPKIEVLPLMAHITNWLLLTWNLILHAQFLQWTPLILGATAIAGFTIAKFAKKRGIDWLYQTDTLLSQLVAMAAIATIGQFSIKSLDVALLVTAEVVLFNWICLFNKERFLLGIGHYLLLISNVISIYYILQTASEATNEQLLPLYTKIALMAILHWGYQVYVSIKNLESSDFRFALFEERGQKILLSMMGLFGCMFFFILYSYGFHSLLVQPFCLFLAGSIAVWRKLKEDHSWNIHFILLLMMMQGVQWFHLSSGINEIGSNYCFIGMLLLDIFLVSGNFLQLKLWKKNIHNLLIYAFAIQLGLLSYQLTKEISVLIPGLSFLGFSLLALELTRFIPSKPEDEVNLKIKEGIIQAGFAFLIAFIGRFITVDLQIDPIWHGISLRWITEILGISAIFYWLAYPYKKDSFSQFTKFCYRHLVEGFLAFVTLCAFVEMPEHLRPIVWALMAIGLGFSCMINKAPYKLIAYSWIYLLASIGHVAFATSRLTMPNFFLFEHHHLSTYIAIALQLFYLFLVLKLKPKLQMKIEISTKIWIKKFLSTVYFQPSLTILLPIFLGIAFLFTFNFERTVLTLLWVGLTGIYLAISLWMKSKISIQIAMCTLVFCSLRLMIFDLVQSDLFARALVFFGVGSLMLVISVLYKKYKHRIESHETA